MMMVGIAPTPAFAQVASPTPDPNLQSSPTPTPNNGPTGSSAHTFHYNDSTGLWENDYYTYNPSTKETVPKFTLEYACNPDTLKWDTKMWQYIASDDAYEQVPLSLSVLPDGATVTQECPAPDPAVMSSTDTTGTDIGGTPAGDTQSATAANDLSTPNTNGPTNNNGNTQSSTNGVTLNTNVNSNATSGNGLVVNNDDVAGVGTGNASAMANIVNMLQSQASFAGSGINTFTANIQGNVQGDFVIDPANLAQPASINPSTLSNTKITAVNNGTINNNIALDATSGNATARNNDDVGSVTTGDATAIADVVNMINSVVAANQSFMGVINIYGDYSGNILMPVDSLNALLASSGGTADVTNTTNADTKSNMNINNNVSLGATSGTATAGNNDDVGSVTTGNAMTNLTILNLTGRQVVAANSLLVFVNVLGNWVGLIMDAPAGTTAAALGGGVSNNAMLANASDISSTDNFAINNNITANARSGDATATNNDDVGSVATGNAKAGVNLANLINSNFSLSNWFGVLFINVFGNWHGNFGVMKPPVVPAITSGSAIPGMGGGSDMLKDAKVFAFVPAGSGTTAHSGGLKLSPVTVSGTNGSNGGSNGTTDSNNVVRKATAVLGASHLPLQTRSNVPQVATASVNYWTIIFLTVGTLGLSFVAIERVRSSVRSRR
jgi:hypothetical protein